MGQSITVKVRATLDSLEDELRREIERELEQRYNPSRNHNVAKLNSTFAAVIARSAAKRVKKREEKRPPFADTISVVAWASDLPGGATSDIPRNVRAIDLYLVQEKRWVTDFQFWAADPQSLKDGLSRYPRIDDLFIIAHGIWEPTFVISTTPRPTSGDVPGHFGESYFLSGISAEEVVEICKPYLAGGALHICACNFSEIWEQRQEEFFNVRIKHGPYYVCEDYRPAIQYLYEAHGLESNIEG
ncbi:MAG TPA: hypothetical protein VMX79_11520 [bacterium]|nr:hypothetical protein [bacterium]